MDIIIRRNCCVGLVQQRRNIKEKADLWELGQLWNSFLSRSSSLSSISLFSFFFSFVLSLSLSSLNHSSYGGGPGEEETGEGILSYRGWIASRIGAGEAADLRRGGGGEAAEKRNWESLLGFLDNKDDEDEEEGDEREREEEEEDEDEDEEDEPRVAPARRQRHVEVRRDCPYLDTVDRQGKKVDTSQRTNDLPSQWEAEAANAIRDIAALKKEIEQTVQTSNELLDQLESYVGEDIVRFFESSVGEDIFFVHSISGFQWKGVQKYEKLFSEINKSHHAALNGLRQMTGIIEKMPHVLIDKEPVNPSLPDDAEVNAPNNTQ